MQNHSVLFLTLGGRELYSLMKNLAFPNVPAELPFEKLKSLLRDHILPVDFQVTERAKLNSMIRAANTPCREFILQLNKQASKCNYGDRLEEQLCDRLIAGINNISLQRKMLEKKDITFAEARKIFEKSDDSPQSVYSGRLSNALLQGSITLHANNDIPITSHLQHLIVQCSGNVGGMKVPSVKLEVDGKPIFIKRRVRHTVNEKGVLKALQKMEQDGVISKVESSAWATPIVVAMKSDVFFQDRFGGRTPTDSNFLPFGLHVSSELFQLAINSVIKGLDGVLAYQDDVLIFGLNKKEHDARLTQLLERFAARNVAIKPSKCVFGVSELEILGFTVDSRGYRPDPTRFKPLTNTESPKDQTHLRSVMGCLQYYSRLIPNFSTRAQPLFPYSVFRRLRMVGGV
ncbi:unnamed protein product [Echinostoma caproni]|uniref:Reverse transcriptase domain-containing protein n=1 Tax=Echinostoma caproni TaxID=27848 RepID=A0A183AI58_9TREM|nr:unnamed protein product [Echinostoma caproni]